MHDTHNTLALLFGSNPHTRLLRLERAAVTSMMIPVVDVGSCLVSETEGGDSSAFKEAAKLFHDAISEHGVCYLSNHGVTQSALDDLKSASMSFFQQPEDVKRKCLRTAPNSRGWTPLEAERLNPERLHGDMKETFNYTPCEDGPGWLTEEVPDMGKSYEEVFRQCQQLAYRVFDLISLALEFKDRSFITKCHKLISKKGNFTTLRCAYYPPCSDLKEDQVSGGEHFDYGSMTLFFQDDVGGFQILGKDGEYHDITPVPGAVLVYMGAVVERWTSNKYSAMRHRVIMPQKAVQDGRTRHSIVFYTLPDDDVVVECLDGSSKYPPIKYVDLLMQLLGKVY